MNSILVGEFCINRNDKRHIYKEDSNLRVYIANTTILAIDTPNNLFCDMTTLKDAYVKAGFELIDMKFDKHGLRITGFA